VVERLDKSVPRRFKLIYIVRDPIDRIESHARHTQLTRKELGQTISPRSDHSLDVGVSPVSLATSRYTHQLQQYRRQLDSGELLVITLDDISERPKHTLDRIWDFLDLVSFEDQRFLSSNEFRKRREMPDSIKLVRRLIPFRKQFRSVFGQETTERFIHFWLRPPQIDGRFQFTEKERLDLEALYYAEYELLNQLQRQGD
jgi:hypothetical protein